MRGLFVRASLSTTAAALAAWLAFAPNVVAQATVVAGNLNNFDLRYPPSLPNDVEIVIYGPNLQASDITSAWDTSNPYRPLGWGPPASVEVVPNFVNPDDPGFPGNGMTCITVRWAGPPRPDLVGQLVHLGISLRPGVAPVHWEVWWTLDGVRIRRPCDPRITWMCVRDEWLVCIENPTPMPFYVYGCRWFQPQPGAPLPFLRDLTLDIEPARFGGEWVRVPIPGGGRVICVPPWCRFYVRVPVTRWFPIVFQIAARNVDDSTAFPAPEDPSEDDWRPNPDDPDGGQGTVAILTTRATQQFVEDVDGNGAVGSTDLRAVRLGQGQVSVDLNPQDQGGNGGLRPPITVPPLRLGPANN
jgi:hypothetical protein